MRNADCIFCKIVAAEVPAAVVYEDDSVLAFLDVNPLADGHLLVVPREHYVHLVDTPAHVLSEIASVLPKLGRALTQVAGAEGFNVLQNNGRVAGQVVEHIHFHLIPRKTGDGLGYRWNAGKYPAGREVQLAAAFQASLARH
jgi:histidine triad (HIT) family protein